MPSPVVAQRKCGGYDKSIFSIFDELDVSKDAAGYRKVIIKPNLVENAPHPVTTDAACVGAIIKYFKEHAFAGEIIVAEGSGGGDTLEIMSALGYDDLKRYGVELVDLDREKTFVSRNPSCVHFKELLLPATLKDGYLISAACLKEHTITGVTLSLKNLIGCLPAEHYGGYWSFKKSQVHKYDEHQVICDINRHIKINLAVIDARIGQKGSHLKGGTPMNPPCGKALASYSAVDCDIAGCGLLGIKPENVKHLAMIKEGLI